MQKLVEELARPYAKSKRKREFDGDNPSSEGPEQKKKCQVKACCKNNRTVGTCSSCEKSVCGKCVAITKRQCAKCANNEA